MIKSLSCQQVSDSLQCLKLVTFEAVYAMLPFTGCRGCGVSLQAEAHGWLPHKAQANMHHYIAVVATVECGK